MTIGFACEHCGQKLTVSASRAGQRGKCPKCRQPIVVPAPKGDAPAPTVKTPPVPAAAPAPTPATVADSVPAAPPPSVAAPPDSLEREPVTAATQAESAVPPAPPVVAAGEASHSSAAGEATAAPPPIRSLAQPPAPPEPASPPPPPAPPEPPLPPPPQVVAPPPAAEATTADSDENLPEWIAQSPREESPWIYVDPTAESKAEPTVARNIDLSRVSLPRYVIFAQGVTLGVVALMAFALGLLAGGSDRSAGSGAVGAGSPCVVSGIVEHVTSGGTKFADEGAVVICFPRDQRPGTDERAAAAGLRPDDPAPSSAVPGMKMLQLMGAVYARTDVTGRFRMTVPRGGGYYVLVVSHHASRRSGREIGRADLAALGRYFSSPGDLIGDRRYRWRAEDFLRDTELNVVLE